jgi:hypothetical protein
VQIADRILNAAAAGERDLKTLVHQAIVDATK